MIEVLKHAFDALVVEQYEVTIFNLVPKPHITKAIASLSQAIAELESQEPPAAQPAQKPASITYKEVADAMNELRKGTFEQRQIAAEMENKRLYTSPPQRPWVGLTDADCKGMSAGDRIVAMWADRTLKEKNT